jgi:hypothetical protein
MILSSAKEHEVMTAFGQLPKKTATGYPQHIPLTTTNVACDCGEGQISVRGHRNTSLETNPMSSPAAAIYSVAYHCNAKGCSISGQDRAWTMPT